jgi:hypothetical protein
MAQFPPSPHDNRYPFAMQRLEFGLGIYID